MIKLEGSFVAMPTPFTADNKIDPDQPPDQVRHQPDLRAGLRR